MTKKPILITKGYLNGQHCHVYGHPEWEEGIGAGSLPTEDKAFIELHVSLQGSWQEVVDTFLHELTEMSMVLKELCYTQHNRAHYDYTTRHFHMDHGQFTEMLSVASGLAMVVLTGERPLEKAWCRANNQKVVK